MNLSLKNWTILAATTLLLIGLAAQYYGGNASHTYSAKVVPAGEVTNLTELKSFDSISRHFNSGKVGDIFKVTASLVPKSIAWLGTPASGSYVAALSVEGLQNNVLTIIGRTKGAPAGGDLNNDIDKNSLSPAPMYLQLRYARQSMSTPSTNDPVAKYPSLIKIMQSKTKGSLGDDFVFERLMLDSSPSGEVILSYGKSEMRTITILSIALILFSLYWVARTSQIFTKKTRQRGASLIEAALVVSLIAMVCIVSVRSLGKNVSCSLSKDADAINGPQQVMGMTYTTAGQCCTTGIILCSDPGDTDNPPSGCGCIGFLIM